MTINKQTSKYIIIGFGNFQEIMHCSEAWILPPPSPNIFCAQADVPVLSPLQLPCSQQGRFLAHSLAQAAHPHSWWATSCWESAFSYQTCFFFITHIFAHALGFAGPSLFCSWFVVVVLIVPEIGRDQHLVWCGISIRGHPHPWASLPKALLLTCEGQEPLWKGKRVTAGVGPHPQLCSLPSGLS